MQHVLVNTSVSFTETLSFNNSTLLSELTNLLNEMFFSDTYSWLSILCISSLTGLVDEPQSSASLFLLSSLTEVLTESSALLGLLVCEACLQWERVSVEGGVATC